MGRATGFKQGAKVEFFRSHDKANKLTGTVKGIDEEQDALIVESDEVNGNTAREYHVHPDDAKVIASEPVKNSSRRVASLAKGIAEDRAE